MASLRRTMALSTQFERARAVEAHPYAPLRAGWRRMPHPCVLICLTVDGTREEVERDAIISSYVRYLPIGVRGTVGRQYNHLFLRCAVFACA